MASLDQTIKCPICGRPYKFYSMMVGDQSACPSCVKEAERRVINPGNDKLDKYRRRRQHHFD